MYSSEDFKRILELYKQSPRQVASRLLPSAKRTVSFIPSFERWYKNRHKVKVHAVDIADKDGASVRAIIEG